jgi:predicted transposase/invertase (TIGR01784 family)
MKTSFFPSLPEELQGIVFVDLRNDYAFKMVFGTPGNEDLLLHLVQTILPDKRIISVALFPQEQVGLRPNARKSAIDVKCQTNDGSTFIIEMQIRKQNDFSDRMVFYSSFPIVNELRKGESNSFRLTPLYMVGITDFIIPEIPANDDLINHYTIRNVKDNGLQFTDSIHYITVELPKLKKSLAEVKNTPEWVLYTIRNIGEMKEMPQEYVGSYLEKIFELTKFAAMSEADQWEILARFMKERDELSQMRTAQEDARAAGLAEGRTEGLAEGRAEGRAENQRDTARRMLSDGMDPELVAKYSLLTVEEVRQLSVTPADK